MAYSQMFDGCGSPKTEPLAKAIMSHKKVEDLLAYRIVAFITLKKKIKNKPNIEFSSKLKHKI